MILRTSSGQARRAVTAVETAVTSIVCLLFMFAIFEYGRYVMIRQIMENAARSGARVAVVTPTSYLTPAASDAALNQAVTEALADQPLQNLVVTAFQSDSAGSSIGTWTSTPFGRNLVVQLDGDLSTIFPTYGWLPTNGAVPGSIHITVRTMMRSEAN